MVHDMYYSYRLCRIDSLIRMYIVKNSHVYSKILNTLVYKILEKKQVFFRSINDDKIHKLIVCDIGCEDLDRIEAVSNQLYVHHYS